MAMEIDTKAFSPSRKKQKVVANSIDDENAMWVEKYRPQDLSDVISHKNIISTITKLIEVKKMPHLLFYGPPGTGKTTTVLAIAKALNGPRWRCMTLELNASDERGIGVVRDRIKTFAGTKQIFAKGYKMVILDEADSMTSAAQFALRRVIEKYTKNTRFCLICNFVNKIIPAVQSRCTKFRFAPLEKEDVEQRLQMVADQEGVNLTQEGRNSIIDLAGGDMRKCLNVLQAAHMAYDEVNLTNVYMCTGSALPSDIDNCAQVLLNENFPTAFAMISSLCKEKGLALSDILGSLHPILLRIKFPPTVMMNLLKRLSDLEVRLAVSNNDRIQMGSLVGIFQMAKSEMFNIHNKH